MSIGSEIGIFCSGQYALVFGFPHCSLWCVGFPGALSDSWAYNVIQQGNSSLPTLQVRQHISIISIEYS